MLLYPRYVNSAIEKTVIIFALVSRDALKSIIKYTISEDILSIKLLQLIAYAIVVE